jgi:cytolysin (calcineurin-like family phosphatase)
MLQVAVRGPDASIEPPSITRPGPSMEPLHVPVAGHGLRNAGLSGQGGPATSCVKLRLLGKIAEPLGVIIGGDKTDDGGGQVATPGEGSQLRQFSQRYQQGVGPDRLHFPVYTGLGNHDLDQDGPPPQVDWYRRELRDYVELNHRPTVFFKPPVPVSNCGVRQLLLGLGRTPSDPGAPLRG